jgi:hypothetical protein
MKRYFIVEIGEDFGGALGFSTDNLHKDFIQRYKITFDISEDENPFDIPYIQNLEVGVGNRVIIIFDTNQGPQRPGIDIKSNIGEFNLFTEDFYDDLQDFIQENWREIEMSMDESISVKKFKDFI